MFGPLRLKCCTSCRIKFESDQVKALQERLETLKAIATKERKALKQLEAARNAIQEESDKAEAGIASLREDLETSNAALEEKTKGLDDVKRASGRAAKALDKALKEIASKVRQFDIFSFCAYADAPCYRMTTSRSVRPNDSLSIASVSSRRSTFRSFEEVLIKFPWKR